jgi:hypothetical protein
MNLNQGHNGYNAYNGYEKNKVNNLIGYSQTGYIRKRDLQSEKGPVKTLQIKFKRFAKQYKNQSFLNNM